MAYFHEFQAVTLNYWLKWQQISESLASVCVCMSLYVSKFRYLWFGLLFCVGRNIFFPRLQSFSPSFNMKPIKECNWMYYHVIDELSSHNRDRFMRHGYFRVDFGRRMRKREREKFRVNESILRCDLLFSIVNLLHDIRIMFRWTGFMW